MIPTHPQEDQSIAWPVIQKIDGDAVLIVDRIANSQDGLHPVEESYAEGMNARRLREYRAGRSVARRAIQSAGGLITGIAAGVDGEPVWPEGVSGSLSHAGGYAAALVALQINLASVGLDINDGRPLGQAAADLMSDEEIALVLRGGWADGLDFARNVVFSAKEALFKCQYPLTRFRGLDFDAVVLAPGEDPTYLTACGVNLPIEIDAVVRRIRLVPTIIQGVMLVLALIAAREPKSYV